MWITCGFGDMYSFAVNKLSIEWEYDVEIILFFHTNPFKTVDYVCEKGYTHYFALLILLI